MTYNIHMKNTKAIFLIVLGAFLMASGFAFAAESETYNRLAANGNPFGDSRASDITPVNITAPALTNADKAIPTPTGVNTNATRNNDATVTKETTPPPAPKPTIGESIKSFLGEHRKDILLGGLGAYIGWALVGTVAGALTGGIFFLAFFALAAM
jgi:hypothetical protein